MHRRELSIQVGLRFISQESELRHDLHRHQPKKCRFRLPRSWQCGLDGRMWCKPLLRRYCGAMGETPKHVHIRDEKVARTRGEVPHSGPIPKINHCFSMGAKPLSLAQLRTPACKDPSWHLLRSCQLNQSSSDRPCYPHITDTWKVRKHTTALKS